jgi:hypothetical protein
MVFMKTTNGEQVQFSTGAVRSSEAEGTRYDLISPIGLRRVAETCHEGAVKYTDFNWEKGMPVSDLLNHVIKHIYQYMSGDRSEDHLGHAAWGMLASCHSEELWPELNAGTLRLAGCTPPAGKVGDREKADLFNAQLDALSAADELAAAERFGCL